MDPKKELEFGLDLVERILRVNCIIMQKGADIEIMKHPASNPAPPARDTGGVSGGCALCGIANDMRPMGYVCPRDGCPTRATS